MLRERPRSLHLLKTRDGAAQFAMLSAASGVAATPLDLLMRRREERLPLLVLLLAVPLASLAAMVPVTIAGLGVRDGAWLALLSMLGYPAAPALACSLLYFATTALAGAIGGLLFVSSGTEKKVSSAR